MSVRRYVRAVLPPVSENRKKEPHFPSQQPAISLLLVLPHASKQSCQSQSRRERLLSSKQVKRKLSSIHPSIHSDVISSHLILQPHIPANYSTSVKPNHEKSIGRSTNSTPCPPSFRSPSFKLPMLSLFKLCLAIPPNPCAPL